MSYMNAPLLSDQLLECHQTTLETCYKSSTGENDVHDDITDNV